MINKALKVIKSLLNEHLKLAFSLDDDITVLNYLVDQDGSVPQKNQNKIVISLINLDLDRSKPFYGGNQRLSNSEYARVNPSSRFNLHLIFTANFDDYEESLKFLNGVIEFFNSNSTLNNLPGGIDTLYFETENSDYMETHNLWSAMGAKYLPSIIYKVRSIVIDPSHIKEIDQSVLNPKTEVGV